MTKTIQKITPHLWFDKEAKDAAEFYTSIFSNSKVTNVTTLHNTPSGDTDIVSFELRKMPFIAISAGPFFKFNPSISFLVSCNTTDESERLWQRLSKHGEILMEYNTYPWAERYGWLNDRFGLSWQIMVHREQINKQSISPVLMFVGSLYGKAEEAINYYTSIFPKSKIRHITRYNDGEEPDKKGNVKFASFILEGQEFGALDSAHEHNFAFNEAISFIIHCDTQKEIDYYWNKLSAVPESEQCGWLKDKFGISWQIVPSGMEEMMKKGSKEQIARVTKSFLKMKKFDITKLKQAYEG
ncbi:VOC family protein [Candidatus Gottesmanbacteria bacterium]|nr:VOC family protein [Candidatus Gottesmanbacteria bacterium]